jgi:putative transcriptional regulator
MVKYHPEARFLTDYAAGSLPEEQALCVATHLHYCATCRVKVRELTELGSVLFMQLMQQPCAGQAAPAVDKDFGRLMSRISSLPATPVAHAATASTTANVSALPRPLHKLARGNIETLKWRRIGNGFRYSRLNVGSPQRETSLLHIKAGSSVPHHRHAGDEITVIIKGSFSDHDDKYGVGDFIVRTTGEQHQPVASQDADCLCLSTLDKPLIFSNVFYRLLAPFF